MNAATAHYMQTHNSFLGKFAKSSTESKVLRSTAVRMLVVADE
jgi:hypothetical protein